MADVLGSLNQAIQNIYTFNERMDRMERGLQELSSKIDALRLDFSQIFKDVAVVQTTVQEQRRTFEAEMRAVVAETVYDLRTRYEQQQSPARSNSPRLPSGDESS